METRFGQSQILKRSTWLPNRLCARPVVISFLRAGFNIDRQWSIQQLCSQCFSSRSLNRYPYAKQPAEKVFRLIFPLSVAGEGGTWHLCVKRRRIIRRLQLIFSPRFSSGKKKAPASHSDSPVWHESNGELSSLCDGPCLTTVAGCESRWTAAASVHA